MPFWVCYALCSNKRIQLTVFYDLIFQADLLSKSPNSTSLASVKGERQRFKDYIVHVKGHTRTTGIQRRFPPKCFENTF